MKKVLVIVSIFILIAFGVFQLAKNNIGDIRPALVPSGANIADQLEKAENTPPKTGGPVNLPLTIQDGFQIGLFAKDIPSARDLEFSPEGTLIVSSPASGQVYALPDRNKDGKVDAVRTLINKLNRPHGLAFYENYLFVAEATRLVRYKYDEANLFAQEDKVLINNLPTGNHEAHTIVFDKQGRLFLKIGSKCNVCVEEDNRRATIMVTDKDGNNPQVFARGLRNAPFLTFRPETDELWVTEMGRDFLGDNLPPDEINVVQEGKDYGWPICYGNKVHDTNFDKRSLPPAGVKKESVADPCQDTVAPAFEFPAHSAPLGLAFIESEQFPEDQKGDLLVAYHGSWNRSSPTGYKVVRLNVERNKVSGAEDFLTGFLEKSTAKGRPVDLIFDKQGSLYVSDDKAGAVYKIIKK